MHAPKPKKKSLWILVIGNGTHLLQNKSANPEVNKKARNSMKYYEMVNTGE